MRLNKSVDEVLKMLKARKLKGLTGRVGIVIVNGKIPRFEYPLDLSKSERIICKNGCIFAEKGGDK